MTCMQILKLCSKKAEFVHFHTSTDWTKRDKERKIDHLDNGGEKKVNKSKIGRKRDKMGGHKNFYQRRK